jgi:hypothetical protein
MMQWQETKCYQSNLKDPISKTSQHMTYSNQHWKTTLIGTWSMRSQEFKKRQATHMHGWIVIATSNQVAKIKENYIRVQQGVLHPTIPKNESRRRGANASKQKKKRDCLKLCLYNLPKRATMEMITYAVKKKMGAKNVVDIDYHASEGEKHSGRANVECLNPIVYKQFLDKTIPILGSHVEFTPHPKNLEGTSPPTEENLKKYGFCDNNIVLVNTIEALENMTAPNIRLTKEDVEAIVEKGGKKLKKEILSEAQAYAEKQDCHTGHPEAYGGV